MKCFNLIGFLIVLCSIPAMSQETGTITGIIVDKSNGEGLIGSFAKAEGTDIVGFTDINGAYSLVVPAGTYAVTGNMDGFAQARVDGVVVVAGETVVINLEMGAEGVQESLVVTADLLQNSEIGLLKNRQRSVQISDAISAEEISRSGGSNAADAVTKVVGASVVGGKYVYIRGLGDRYTSTHLNGVELPTSDPDVKAFQADLFPSNILDSIVTLKSFTPDKPGNFSGGIIDIGTKNYPEQFTLNFALDASYNSQSTGNGDFLLYDGGDRDWLGYDDGLRAFPDTVAGDIPSIFTARNNEAEANRLDEATRAFVPVMAPTEENAPLNNGFSISVGDRVNLWGRKLGYLASLTYNRKYEFLDNRRTARWKLSELVADADSLIPQSDFTGQRGTDKVNWGGLVTLNYTVHPNHEIGTNIIYTQGGESVGQYYLGQWPEQFSSDNAFLESRLLKYTERTLDSFQLQGKHFFPGSEITVDWTASTASSSQDEPDTRIFTDNFSVNQRNGEEFLVYSITPSIYNNPARYFRSTEEDSDNFAFNVTIPFQQWQGLGARVKVGGSFETKDRFFTEDRYEYVPGSSAIRYNGDPNFFFGPDNIGIIGFDEQRNRFIFGNVIERAPDSRGGNYEGTMDVNAFYAMIDLPLNAQWKLIGGARTESAEMEVFNEDTVGTLDDDDILPSLAVIYTPADNMNWRFSYGKTLARPTFREKAPYSNFDFIADGIFAGNPDLKRTLIDNFDLRWEMFPRGGELIAASVFYKDFENPIERSFNIRFASEFGEKTFTNVDAATVYGAEIEFRKRFDGLAAQGSPHVFSGSSNFSLIESEVDIPQEELEFLLQRDPDADTSRRLQGQSDFLFNLGINYDNFETNTSASVFYNLFGERLDEVGLGGAPNSLEQPRGTLDFFFNQVLWRDFTLKFSAKNLTDEDIEILQNFKGQDFIRELYSTGSTYSLKISYKPN